jgi:eukaryotic-like serine/threonine-protein kinase
MIPGVPTAVEASRSPRGDGGDVGPSGSTVTRAGGGGPDRASFSSRARQMGPMPAGRPAPDSLRSVLPTVVHEFTAAWERGDSPAVEDYLLRLDPADGQGAVDLIYREFCLAEADGRAPVPDAYVARFPRHAEALESLFRIHGACSPSLLGRLLGPPPGSRGGSWGAGETGAGLPEVGDSIGPYVLRRELGRGSFARVYLAEQADLANRLVVVKISTRSTREPWLLAKARHAHIVEILSHAEVDDGAFQLICMPFWGGATLADVLAAPSPASGRDSGPGSSTARGGAVRRPRGRGPATGADLLAALDAVAAPEYPSVHPARPAREILAPLSYGRAIAWVIARLAEALDHASGRDVAHGDVKPSNILLSADGNPMLLDFNLARDVAPALHPSGGPIDPGGTLAYMAPERLRALALAGSGRAERPSDVEGEAPAPDRDLDDRSAARAAHVSDIYSLGMVMLEALSGRPPTEATVPAGHEADPAWRPTRLILTALAYAAARDRPAQALVRDFEAASGRPIAPALRAILGRCLDPDPSRRYRRALELAEDLDRWRTDRPLAYADEPFWGQAVPRWLRVHRRKLIVAAASILALVLATAAMVQVGSNRLLIRDLETAALRKMATKLDDPESGAFLRSQRQAAPHSSAPEDPEAFEVARHALLDYGVIGPGGVPTEGDWRLRDDVRYLPPADREDLEVWLMERAYRYCLALEGRPGSPDDWRQALEVLDRVDGHRSIRAFAPLRDRLAARLGLAPGRGSPDGAGSYRETGHPGAHLVGGGSVPRPESVAAPAPEWLNEHLLGFAAECRTATDPEPDSTPETDDVRRAAIERALGHYNRALAGRPGSFWAHYRAASACFGLGRKGEAAHHLAQSLRRRPCNAVVRAQLARCLIESGRSAEALEQCDLALERAPGFAEIYRTRIFARAVSRQTAGIDEDVMHFEMFSRLLPPSLWGGSGPESPMKDGDLIGAVFQGLVDPRSGPAGRRGRNPAIRVDSEEIDARAIIAEALRQAGLSPLAHAEYEKILVLKPDHIPARIWHAQQAIADRRFDAARADLDVVLRHPGLEDYVRGYSDSLISLFDVARKYLIAGRADDARWVIEPARGLAIQFRRDVGRAHYRSAEVYAVLGASDPDYIEKAAAQLFRAFIANPDFLKWYRNPSDRFFDPVRARIDAALGRLEDPEVVRRRIMARRAAKAADQVAGR